MDADRFLGTSRQPRPPSSSLLISAAAGGARHAPEYVHARTRVEADGTYTNESGNHAAIYLYQDDRGIWVYDQWQGQPVHKRLIRFEGGSGAKWGSKSNDGTRFAVIE